MALSTFYTSDPDGQIKKMAKRYLRKERSPKVKKILKCIINDPEPRLMAHEVYEERFNT